MDKNPFDPSDSENLQDRSAAQADSSAAESASSDSDSKASSRPLKRSEKHARLSEEPDSSDSLSSDSPDPSAVSGSEEENDPEAQKNAAGQEDEAETAWLPVIVESDEIADEILTELDQKRQEASKTVLTFTATAAATGALPIPLADAPLLIAQQVAMIARLSDIYQINLKKSGLKSLVFTVLGVSGTTVLGKTIAGSLMKAIPGIGSVGGATLSATTAAALTAALGAAYGEVCEKVFLGDLDESRLLEYEGRHLLETSFKNHLRIELDARKHQQKENDDVLRQRPVPQDEEAIALHTDIRQADASDQSPKSSHDVNPSQNSDDSEN